MFGMVVSAGVKMLSDVDWNSRNMVIFAISISIGLGLMLEPLALQHLPNSVKPLMSNGLLPAAVISIVLNLAVPEHLK
jgi:NCS2 family nucleobase:cation symporter-2